MDLTVNKTMKDYIDSTDIKNIEDKIKFYKLAYRNFYTSPIKISVDICCICFTRKGIDPYCSSCVDCLRSFCDECYDLSHCSDCGDGCCDDCIQGSLCSDCHRKRPIKIANRRKTAQLNKIEKFTELD